MVNFDSLARATGLAVMKTTIAATLLLMLGIQSGIAAADLSRTVAFNIPPQVLTAALLKYSEQSGVQVTSPSAILDGKSSGGVVGSFPAHTALERLLAGTELGYDVIDRNTVAIRAAGAVNANPNDTAPTPTAPQAIDNPESPGPSTRLARNESQGSRNSDTSKEGEPSRSAPSGETRSSALEEIIVTAQKREERLLDVPLSISAFTNEMMQEIGAADLLDFIGTVPGVDFRANGNGFQSIHIRGIAPTLNDAPVGFYLDELPFTFLGAPNVPDVRTYDLERVEVLRGPQGTLYGDGSIGGTIRLLTANPNLQDFQANVDLTAMDTTDGKESYGAKAMVNVPIKEDVLGLRLVGTKEELGGWIDRSTGVKDYNDRDVDTYRVKLRLTPTERLDVILSAWHSKQEINGNSLSRVDRTTPLVPLTGPIEYDLYSATVEYEFDAFNLLSATSFMEFSFPLAGAFFGIPFTQDDTSDILSEELRLTSTGDGIFRWTAGLFYREIERDLNAVSIVPDIFSNTSESYAVFGEGTWSLLDRKMDVTLGLRYFEDDRVLRNVPNAAVLAEIRAIDPTFTGEEQGTYDTISPRFNLAFHPNEDWLLYTNVAKGFRSGQVQTITSLISAIRARISVPVNIDEETLWSYEVGAKGSFAGGRAVLESAVFYNDWDNVQTQVTVDPVLRISALINAGPARTQGIELGVTVQPAEGLTLRLAGSYVDGEYRENIPGTNVRAGDRIRNIPETTASASATYRWPLVSTLNGFVYGGAQYSSDQVGDPAFNLPSDDHQVYDLRLGVEGERWGAYLFGDNLTDEDAATSPVASTPVAAPTLTAIRPRPRTLGVNLRYSFN